MTTIRGPLPESPRPDYPWQGNDLSQREVDMLRLAETGDQLDLDKGPFDLPAMENWGPERTIRAAVLRQLLIGQQWPVDPKGVRLRGLRISGRLDLEAATIRCPLQLQDCYLDGPGPVLLDFATVSVLTFTGCYLAGLVGDSLTVTKDLNLTGSTFTGPLRLISASVAGSLNCRGAQLTAANSAGSALIAHRMKVGGSVDLGGGFTAAGAIDLTGADITHNLTCRGGAQLKGANRDGNALFADATRVGNHVLLDNGFTAAGAIWLYDADIGGELSLRGAQLTAASPDGNALAANRMKAGTVSLDGWAADDGVVQPFTAVGTIDLTDAEITGFLSCTGARLTAGPGGNALVAYRMKAGAVSLDGQAAGGGGVVQPFTAVGTVDLTDAEITGSLSCAGARLTAGPGGNALAADRAKVGGDMSFDGVVAGAGALQLAAASIAGLLSCRGARLTGAETDGKALVAYQVKAGAVSLDGQAADDGVVQPFTAVGTVDLTDAEITRFLSCTGARLTAGPGGNALAADRVKVGGDMSFDGVVAGAGALRLAAANIAGLLNCRGTRLSGTDTDGNALVAYQIKAGTVWLDGQAADDGVVQPFTAAGTIDLTDAEITRVLSCTGARLTAGPGGNALVAYRMKAGAVSLDGQAAGGGGVVQPFTAVGTVDLTDAEITGSLSCTGARLTAGPGGNALVAYRMKAGAVSLDGQAAGGGGVVQPFTAVGAVDLTDAEITGSLSCAGAWLTAGPGGNALAADRVKVGGDMSFDGVVAGAGALRLAAASIAGLLSCRGGRLTGAETDGNALVAYQIKAGAVSLDGQAADDGVVQPFTAVGTVDLTDAEITGSLSCTGAQLTAGPGGNALVAGQMKSRQGVA